MKKILASILVLTMLVCCMSISAFAVEAPATLTIEDATVTAGKTVQMPVTIKVTGELAAVLCHVSIDGLEGAEITKIANGMWTLDNGAVEKNVANGTFDWYKSSNVDLEEFGEGNIVTVTISVPADAVNGEYTVTLHCEDFAYVASANDEKVTTYDGATYTDTAILTVEGGVEPEAPHEHEAGSAWEKNDEAHWNVCSCGEKLNEGAHAYDNDQDADCNVCGATREVEIPHEHDFSGEWKSDADNHWKECAADGEIGEKAAHNFADDKDATCDTCGSTREVEPEQPEQPENPEDPEKPADPEKPEDGDKEDEKEEDKKDDTTDTGDSTNLYIYMALCLFAAAAIVVTSYELKKTRG